MICNQATSCWWRNTGGSCGGRSSGDDHAIEAALAISQRPLGCHRVKLRHISTFYHGLWYQVLVPIVVVVVAVCILFCCFFVCVLALPHRMMMQRGTQTISMLHTQHVLSCPVQHHLPWKPNVPMPYHPYLVPLRLTPLTLPSQIWPHNYTTHKTYVPIRRHSPSQELILIQPHIAMNLFGLPRTTSESNPHSTPSHLTPRLMVYRNLCYNISYIIPCLFSWFLPIKKQQTMFQATGNGKLHMCFM